MLQLEMAKDQRLGKCSHIAIVEIDRRQTVVGSPISYDLVRGVRRSLILNSTRSRAMSCFYVDGLRDGQPAQALYVKADNVDAAKARAVQLGMEPTGVRPARAISNVSQPKIWPLYVFPFFLMLMCFVEIFGARSSGRPPSTAAMTMISTVPPMIFSIIHHLTRMHQRQQELQSEINDMREQLMSRNLVDGRSS